MDAKRGLLKSDLNMREGLFNWKKRNLTVFISGDAKETAKNPRTR